MKEYIAQPNYEYELTELTEPGKLCGPPGVFVKKYDCARAIVKAREEGRRELEAKVSAMVAVLKDYERWEADLLMCDEAWRDRSYPVFTEKLYASFFSIQGKRNAALLDEEEEGE